jgi:hypothetical protein
MAAGLDDIRELNPIHKACYLLNVLRLALDIGFAGLPLGIERVEFKVEIMLGRFAGVDRSLTRARKAEND